MTLDAIDINARDYYHSQRIHIGQLRYVDIPRTELSRSRFAPGTSPATLICAPGGAHSTQVA